MQKVRIGVLGAGWWATLAHIPAIKASPAAELVAVHSRDRAQAERVTRDFGARHACATTEELLALPDIDAVVVSSTPNVHHAQAKAALESGRHVLLEKPMTLTVAEARELVELAAARCRQLLISCPWHYTRHGLETRRLIQSGALGEIKMISILMTNPVEKLLRGEDTSPAYRRASAYAEPEQGSYSDPAIAGGGQIYCQVSHPAAYLTFLTGQRPAEVFARFDNAGAATDIYDTLSVKLEGGALATIASTGATPEVEHHYEVRVFGRNAILQLELWRGTMMLIDFAGARTEFPPLAPEEIYPAQSPLKNFVEVINGTARNESPGELGLAAMEIIEAASASATNGRNVHIR